MAKILSVDDSKLKVVILKKQNPEVWEQPVGYRSRLIQND